MRATVLISSAGRRVGLIDCFRRSAAAAGIDLDVLAADMEPELSAACHAADRSFVVPRCDCPAFVDSMLEIVVDSSVDLVVPTIDPELAPLAAAADRFRAAGARAFARAPRGERQDVAPTRWGWTHAGPRCGSRRSTAGRGSAETLCPVPRPFVLRR